jgi:serine/threonine protein phosphatase PrpC
MEAVAFAKSHVGQRESNEDWYGLASDLGLFAIADGMGGYRGGEIASRLAVHSLDDYFRNVVEAAAAQEDEERKDDLLLRRRGMNLAFRIANYVVRRRRKGPFSHMGCTLSALVLRHDQALIGHVGDSRVYRLRRGHLRQLTQDHSLVAAMAEAGLDQATQAKYSHVITRAIGLADGASPDVSLVDVEEDDLFLLCTDGLYEMVDDHTMADILRELPPDIACDTLVDMALYAGGHDNITAVVVKVAGHSLSTGASATTL